MDVLFLQYAIKNVYLLETAIFCNMLSWILNIFKWFPSYSVHLFRSLKAFVHIQCLITEALYIAAVSCQSKHSKDRCTEAHILFLDVCFLFLS